MSFFAERWYALPLLSGLLLVLAAPPFNIWPLVFAALAVLYWSITAYPRRTDKEIFLSGCITAGLYMFSLYYLTLFQFEWLPGSENLILLIRAGIVPATLAAAGLLGAGLWVYRRLRTRHIALNACIGGAVFLLFELPFALFFQGYDPGELAYVVAPAPFFLHMAVLGGTVFVSFAVAALACCIAEGFTVWRAGLVRRDILNAVFFAGSLASVGLLGGFLVMPASPVVRTISVAIPQPGAYENILFGTMTAGTFSFPEFKTQFDPASFANADYIFYPQSFFEGFIYTGAQSQSDAAAISQAQVGEWIGQTFPASAIIATWDSVYEGGGTFNEYEFWKGGTVVGMYQKQKLHFLDNTATWLGSIGLYQTRFFYDPGKEATGPIALGGISIGTPVCSEIMHDSIVSTQAKGAQLLLSMTSEAGFIDDTANTISLTAARYRAVEYGIPVVHADAVGPSALINPQGVITAEAPWHTHAVLSGTVSLYTVHLTPYARFGATPLYLLLATLIGLAAGIRFLGKREQG